MPRLTYRPVVSGPARYEKWIGGVCGHQVPERRPFLTPRRAVVAAVSVATWVLLVAMAPLPPALRLPAGTAPAVTYLGALLVWLRTWSVAIERTHTRLLARPDLGDFSRVIVFFAALVGYGMGSMIVAGLVLWLIAR